MRRIALMVALLTFSLSASGQDTGPKDAAGISISITGREWGSEKTIPIRVTRKKGADEIVITADHASPGVVRFDEKECSYAVTYLARPLASILYNGVQPQTCQPNQSAYSFIFSRLAEPSTLTADFAYGLFTGLESASYGQAPEIIQNFANSGDWGSAAFVSTEVAAALRAQGDYQGAANFQSAAVAAGLQAVENATAGFADPSDSTPLLAPGQAWLVPTGAGENAITLYQEANKLPVTGKLDWSTLRSTSILASENIEALGQSKLEAIASLHF